MRRRNGPAARLLKFLANRSLKVELKRDELHIWTIDCDAARHTMASADRFLSAAEKDRAGRFRFDLHRDRYVVAHVAMRSILGAYLDRNPHDLTFAVEGNGKPVLVLESDSIPLRFNLSHSHNAALIAVTRDRTVGIDIEHTRTKIDCAEIAARFFAAEEIAKLKKLSRKAQRQAFFACWTRKEAYIKAKGGGLSIPLQDFAVSLAPHEKPALSWHRTEPQETSRWRFENIDILPGYAAAVAVEGDGCVVKYFRWPEDLPRADENF